jgi:predicted RNA polymerase sigma factor
LYPDHAVAHANLANVLSSLGRREEASEHYRKAVELAPGGQAFRDRLEEAVRRRNGVPGSAPSG